MESTVDTWVQRRAAAAQELSRPSRLLVKEKAGGAGAKQS